MGAGVSMVAVETRVRVDPNDGRLRITESTTPLLFFGASSGHLLDMSDAEVSRRLRRVGGGVNDGMALNHPASIIAAPLSSSYTRPRSLSYDSGPSPSWMRDVGGGNSQRIGMASFQLDSSELEDELYHMLRVPRRSHRRDGTAGENARERAQSAASKRILRLAEALFSMLDELVCTLSAIAVVAVRAAASS
jgi:hypothetical protein